jgi:hypothetical protein
LEKRLIEIITEQTRILFENIQETFNALSDDQMDKFIFDAPLWKHIYHMLHSLDQWFINPYIYDNPDFHEYGMNSFKIETDKGLSKENLVTYFSDIEEKIYLFLNNLNDRSLIETPENCNFTRLTLILAQYRHVMYHIGFITSILHYTEEKRPKFIGISLPMIQ